MQDEEAEAELHQANYIQKKKKTKKKKRGPIGGDDEDIELIQENTGIQIKKRNRLKRIADNDDDSQVKREIEVNHDSQKRFKTDGAMQIDTTDRKPGRADMKSEYYRDRQEFSTKDND